MQRRHHSWLAGLCFACVLCAATARAAEFVITHAETQRRDEIMVLNAGLRFDFSEEVREALDNGVPITLVLELKLSRVRDYLWDANVATMEQRYSLQYHALSEQYIVRNLNSDEQSAHRTLVSVRNYLATITDLPLIDRRLLEEGAQYYLKLRAGIDINALPSPMRPMAWLSADWRLHSEWYTCAVNY
ncbi:MAG: DUF4390 domain-containing protein [Granulosicoccaceae bacterium]